MLKDLEIEEKHNISTAVISDTQKPDETNTSDFLYQS